VPRRVLDAAQGKRLQAQQLIRPPRPDRSSGGDVPTVLRWGPYRAFFYSNEGGEPPHVHVRAGEKEAKFWLHDISPAANAGFAGAW
jgi:hypothetical protein